MKKLLYLVLLVSGMSIFVGTELSASQPKPLPKPPQRKPLPSTPTQPTQVEYPEEVTTLELPSTKSMANLSAADKQKIDILIKNLQDQIEKMPSPRTIPNETQYANILLERYITQGRLNKKTQDGSPRSDYIDRTLIDNFNKQLSDLENYYPLNAKRSKQQIKEKGYSIAEAGPQPIKPTPETTQPTQVEYPEEVTDLPMPTMPSLPATPSDQLTQIEYPEEVTDLPMPPTSTTKTKEKRKGLTNADKAKEKEVREQADQLIKEYGTLSFTPVGKKGKNLQITYPAGKDKAYFMNKIEQLERRFEEPLSNGQKVGDRMKNVKKEINYMKKRFQSSL